MPFTPKTILLAGAVGALAMLGAVEAQAGGLLFAPVGPFDVTDPTMVYPLNDEVIDAAEDAQDVVADTAADAAAAAATAAVAAHALVEDALDN